MSSFWKQELKEDSYWVFQHLSTTCFTLAGLSFASVFAIFAAFGKSGAPPSVISLLIIAGALFALAGEFAREAYFLWKFFAAEFFYIVGLVLFLASFLIFVNTQSVVLSDPILVSLFFGIVIAFFCWRIIHNIHVAQRHVKSISKDVSNVSPSPNKPPKKLVWTYSFAIIVGSIVTFVIAFLVTTLFQSLTSIPPERITNASNAIIQLDSFIVAGFIVGFFYFWERIEELYGRARRKSHTEPVIVVVIYAPITVIFLVASGLFAVWATLTSAITPLAFSVALLIVGLWLVFSAWYSLQSIIQLAEKAKEKD